MKKNRLLLLLQKDGMIDLLPLNKQKNLCLLLYLLELLLVVSKIGMKKNRLLLLLQKDGMIDLL
ncbi:MAG: hypothetical protein EBS36_07530, partial [Actinobacteria bacterium]|nr:hypothetical protein [Actinomycetota bacterium]